MPTQPANETGTDYDVLVGEIVGAHGLIGEAKVTPHTDFPERFEQLDSVYVQPRRTPGKLMRILSVRQRPDRHQVLLKFEGISTPEEVVPLFHALLFVRGNELTPLQEGVYYEFQIVGLTVRTTGGAEIGKITAIIHTGANDVYVTDQCLIPAIRDVIKSVDLEKGELIIEAIPGLLD